MTQTSQDMRLERVSYPFKIFPIQINYPDYTIQIIEPQSLSELIINFGTIFIALNLNHFRYQFFS